MAVVVVVVCVHSSRFTALMCAGCFDVRVIMHDAINPTYIQTAHASKTCTTVLVMTI